MAWALQQENMPGTASDMRSNGGARQLARHRYTRERLPEKSNLIWVC